MAWLRSNTCATSLGVRPKSDFSHTSVRLRPDLDSRCTRTRDFCCHAAETAIRCQTMDRRDFLRMIGSAPLASRITAASEPAATVLYDDQSVNVRGVRLDAQAPESLWIRKRDLRSVNGFEVKPQGACRDDICIPIPKTMTRGEHFDLTAFARKAGQAVVADTGARVWSFGEIQALRGGFLHSRVAPDVTVPDRAGSICQAGRHSTRSSRIAMSRSSPPRRTPAVKLRQANGTTRRTPRSRRWSTRRMP